MLDDLVQHVRREIAIDGASGCNWERFWYFVAAEQDRLYSLSPLAKIKPLPPRQPDQLVPDEKYRRYFWSFILRVKGVKGIIFYIYDPPADAVPVVMKPAAEATILPMEHLKPVQPDQLSYDNVISQYQESLRIAPTMELKNEVLYGIPNATVSFSAAQLEVLERVAVARGRGISQSTLAKELGKDAKSVFHHVKTLIKANLLLKIPISEGGAFTQLVLHKPAAHLHSGYRQWVAENNATASTNKGTSSTSSTGTSTSSIAITEALMDNLDDHADSSHYNSIAKMRVVNLLRKAKGNIMVYDDLAVALGLQPKGTRPLPQQRFLVRLLQQLVFTGHVVRVLSEAHGRCIQLAPAYATGPTSSSTTAGGNAGELTTETGESATDAQLDVDQLIAKGTSSRRGMELGTSLEYQIVRFVVQAGETGVTRKEIGHQFEITKRKLMDKMLEVLTKVRKSGQPALLKRVQELRGRQHLYRYFSAKGYEESLKDDQKEFIEKTGLMAHSSKKKHHKKPTGDATMAPASSKLAATKSTRTVKTQGISTDVVATASNVSAEGSMPSTSQPSVVAPDAADTIPSVEPLSPLSISEDGTPAPASTQDYDGMPPPPTPTKGKSKAKSSSLDAPPSSPSSKKNVDLAALQRREIMLEMMDELRIIEFGQLMIKEYQRKLQARNPHKKITSTIDRKTLMNQAARLEEEGKVRTITRSVMSPTGAMNQRKFLMHIDDDPEDEKIRLYIEGCLNRRTLFLASSLRLERQEVVDVEVERLPELTERLQEDMPAPLPLPSSGFMRESSALGQKADRGDRKGISNGNVGAGAVTGNGQGGGAPVSSAVHFEMIATRYGWRKPKMIRVRHFHEYVFRMALLKAADTDGTQTTAQMSKDHTAQEQPVILRTYDLFANMPLQVFLLVIGIDKEVGSEEQSNWLLKNQTSETKLCDLPLGLASLAEPTAYFKKRMREMFEILDVLGLVTPLVTRDSSSGGVPVRSPISSPSMSSSTSLASSSALYENEFIPAQNHLALNPYYHIHRWADPGLVRLVKVETPTRMRLQTPLDLQNYWISIMRITQHSRQVVKDEDEDIIGGGDDDDLLTDGMESKEDAAGGAASMGSHGTMHERVRTFLSGWRKLKKRAIMQLYNRRHWMTNKMVTMAQGAVLDKFAKYDEGITPVMNADLLLKAAQAAGVSFAEARKHYLGRIYYKNARERRMMRKNARLGDVHSEEDEDSIEGTAKHNRKTMGKGKTPRLASTRTRSNKGKQAMKQEEEEHEPLVTRQRDTRRTAAAKSYRARVGEHSASESIDDSEDEQDKDYEAADDDQEDDDQEDDEDEETATSEAYDGGVTLDEGRRGGPKKKRAPKTMWTAQEEEHLMILDALAYHVSVMLRTRKSWKGIGEAFTPYRGSTVCRRRMYVLKKNPTTLARIRLYRKKWARIFRKEDKSRYFNAQNEIVDAHGLIQVWYERQGDVHIASDIFEEPSLHARRHSDAVDLPLDVSKLHAKYTVISSTERPYSMFYIDENDLRRLSLPLQVAALANWPTTVRAIAQRELDLRLEELEDVPQGENVLEQMMLPQIGPKVAGLSLEGVAVKPSARERYQDEHMILTLWKAVFHLPSKEAEINRERLQRLLAWYTPDQLTSTSVLGREWKVMVRKSANGARIPGQPLATSERFTGTMLGAISRVRSNNAAEFAKSLFGPRASNGGGGENDLLKAQFDFDPQVSASQMMALIHAVEANQIIMFASPTDLEALDTELMPQLTATILDTHHIGPTLTANPTVSSTATAAIEVGKKGIAKKTKKRRQKEDDEEAAHDQQSVVAEAKRHRDSTITGHAGSTPQDKAVYRNWEEVLQVSKTELQRYLATVPDTGRQEVLEKVYGIVLATGSQGILVVDIKDTIANIPFARGTSPSDREILEAIKTLETLFPPALIKVGLAVPRYVANGFQMRWMFCFESDSNTQGLAMGKSTSPAFSPSSSSPSSIKATTSKAASTVAQKTPSTEGELDEVSATTQPAPGVLKTVSEQLQYSQVRLDDYKTPRMWRSMDGRWNKVTFEKCCHSVLTHIVTKPSVTRASLEAEFHKVLMPVELDEILEELEHKRGAIRSRSGLMPNRASLFSKRGLFKPCDAKETIDRRMVTMFFPNTTSGKPYYEYLDMALVRAFHGDDVCTNTQEGHPRISLTSTRGADVEGRLQKRNGHMAGEQVVTTERASSKNKKNNKIGLRTRRSGRPTPVQHEMDEEMQADNDATMSGEDAPASDSTPTDMSSTAASSSITTTVTTRTLVTATTVNTSVTSGVASSADKGKDKSRVSIRPGPESELEIQLGDGDGDGEEEEEDDDDDDEEEESLTLRRRLLRADEEDVDVDDDGFTGAVDDDDDQVILHLDDDEDVDEEEEEDQEDDDAEHEDDPYADSETEGAPAHKKQRSMH